MKTKLKIKSQEFIDWYFNSSSDQEQKDIRMSFGMELAETLFLDGKYTITSREILHRVNTDVIPVKMVKGFEDSDPNLEIGDLDIGNYEIQLI